MALDVYLVRHGDTEWARSSRHTGRTDVALLPEGEEDARALGERLAGISFAAVYSSDLRRALRTAELAGFSRPTVTPLLREVDYGEYEGLTTAEISTLRPGWQLFADGCPGGETPEQMAARARRFLRVLDGQRGAVIVFSHGHFLRALAATWSDLEITTAASLALETAAISVLRETERGRVIQRWNWLPQP